MANRNAEKDPYKLKILELQALLDTEYSINKDHQDYIDTLLDTIKELKYEIEQLTYKGDEYV